jgi:uncharacterized membrane protein
MVNAASLHRLLLVAIVVGLAFSTYATYEVNDPAARNACSINNQFSCARVDSSNYTNIGPIPDYSIGLAGFVVLLALDIPLLATYESRYLFGVIGFAGIGAVVAVGLGAVEVFLIHAICPICLGAYISDAFVLLIALWIWRLRNKDVESSSAETESATKAGSTD